MSKYIQKIIRRILMIITNKCDNKQLINVNTKYAKEGGMIKIINVVRCR